MFYDDYVNVIARKSLLKDLLFMNLMQKQILLPPPLPPSAHEDLGVMSAESVVKDYVLATVIIILAVFFHLSTFLSWYEHANI